MNVLRQRGFSLLELLVTLFVVVIITSLVSLNITIDGGDEELESSLRNIANVSQYALDEAQMRGLDYGLLLQRDSGPDGPRFSYSWRERRPEGWRPPELDTALFAGDSLPGDIELELELEDMPLADWEEVDEEARELDGQAPQVMLHASGEVTAGALDVRSRDRGELLWRLQWDLLGRFELLRRGEADEP